MRERERLRHLERLNAVQGALRRQAQARLVEAIADERMRRNDHDKASTAFVECLEDYRRAMSGGTLDPGLITVFARTTPLIAQTLSQTASALVTAQNGAVFEGLRHAQASIVSHHGRTSERQSRRRLARKLEERSMRAYQDMFALKGPAQ